MKIKFILSFLIFVHFNVYSATLDVTPSVYYFNYEEFSSTGVSLNQETGFLPGIKFSTSIELNKAKFIPYVSFHKANIDYNGFTQGGSPHQTTTDEELTQLGLEIVVIDDETPAGKILFGIQQRIWDRDILPNNNIAGLHELYSWYELSVGRKFVTEQSNNNSLWLDVSVIQVINPKIKIYLQNSSETLYMRQKPGIRSTAGKTWLMQNNSKFSLSFSFEYYEFGRSNTVFTNDFFGNSAFLTEPASRSIHSQFELSYQHRF